MFSQLSKNCLRISTTSMRSQSGSIAPFFNGMRRNYSLNLIKELRRITDAPLGHCKKAIEASNGDLEEAKKWLQMQGIKTAKKKASRVAAEGCIGVAVSENRDSAVLIELNCETDFSANTAIFRELTQAIAAKALQFASGDRDAFLASASESGTVADDLVNVTSKIGENIQLRRMEFFKAAEGQSVASYMHNTFIKGVGEIGVLALVSGEGSEDANSICMQIAAMNPTYITMSDVPASILAEQKEIETVSYQKSLAEGAKVPPQNVIEKIIEGKVNKKLSEEVLMNQEYIMDSKKSVQQAFPGVTVHQFMKFRVGEGVEKVQTNLAEEVSKQAGL